MSELSRRKEAQMVEQAKATVQPLLADPAGDEEEGGLQAAASSFLGATQGSEDTQKSSMSGAMTDSFYQIFQVCSPNSPSRQFVPLGNFKGFPPADPQHMCP